MGTHQPARSRRRDILYNKALFTEVDDRLFEPAALERDGYLVGRTQGRRSAWLLRVGCRDYVLRHYWRGGLPARLLADSYLWLGRERSRAFREWQLLSALTRLGLPVPEPAAARTVRGRLFYQADLITVRLPQTRTLADLAAAGPVPASLWERVGACLRRLHDAGACHADLNARNVLVDERQQVYVIDWDRGRLRSAGAWQGRNLKRLRRSLDKFAASDPGFHFGNGDWQRLLAAYA